MKNLGTILLHLYPDADGTRDFRVQDDGDGRGPYLAYWDEGKLGPRPTDADLLAVAGTAELAVSRAAAQAAIDTAAGAARLKYITAAPGQEAVYVIKAQQARAYRDAGYPAAKIADYAMVQSEAQARVTMPAAADYQAAADFILATEAQWIAIAAAIERARRAGKIAVEAAADTPTIDAARDAAITELRVL